MGHLVRLKKIQVADSSIHLENVPEEQEMLEAKKSIIAAANLVHFSLYHPIKVSKFEIEAKWLEEILTKTLHEVFLWIY